MRRYLLLFFLIGFVPQGHAQGEPLLGQISMFAGNFAPVGWAFCDGQLLPISQNSALFSLLGTMYGGDGRTTFGLPDLRGRTPVHAGNGPGLTPRSQGAKFGTEHHEISVNQLAPHSHGVIRRWSKYRGQHSVPAANRVPARLFQPQVQQTRVYGYRPETTGGMEQVLNPPEIETVSAGGGQAIDHMQPSLAIRYIIAVQGTYPSRP